MPLIMSFHHRDTLKKKPHSDSGAASPARADGAASPTEKPTLLPLSELNVRLKEEPRPVKPKPLDSRYSQAGSYLSPSECDSFKFNQPATPEKDQKLLAAAQRRHKLISGILGFGIPLLVNYVSGHANATEGKHEKHPDDVSVRKAKNDHHP